MTKTYNYINGGVPGSVEVTVNVLACNTIANPEGAEGDLIGFQEIEVTLSEALPFALLLNFTVDYNLITGFGSSSSTYPIILTVPAGLTAHTIEDIQCFERTLDPFSESTWEYTFEEQSETQEVGGPLAASVTSVSDATCFGIPNGSILINASGGSGGYVYIWSDGGPNSPLRSAIPAGTYSVTVRDSALNEVVLSGIVVAQPTQIQANPTITPVTCFGGNNGAINLAPSGGSGSGYSFSWSDGSTLQNRTGLAAGAYQVTITDSDGCTRLVTINVSQPAQIQITVNKSGQNITNTVTGGTAPYTYLWSDGVTLKDRTNIPFGVYSFTVTDANGCQQSTIIVVQEFKFFFSKNPIWLSLAVDDMISKPNLSFVCEVYLEDLYESESFNLKYSSEQPAKADGTTDFNMQQVLNAFLDAHVPVFGDSVVRFVSESFKRFYLSYFEKYGDPPAPDDTTVNETFYVLYGGLSEQEFAKQTFFDSYLDTVKPFLTWSPTTQPIAADQHSYLHFVVVNPVFSSLTLKATVRYSDNTSVTADVKSISPVKNFELVRFPAGVQQLALQALNPTKIIVGYDLQLFSGTTELSEKRTYEVYGVKRHYRKLLYLNSLGGWDHILCFGRGKQSLRTQEETISRDLPVGYSYSDREEETVSKSGMLTGELVIATLNGYQRKHLIDLAISEKVYEQTATGYLPVKVKMDFDPEDDFENLDEIGLDIYYPKIRRYTPEL
jgi:hypothetical protein